LSKIFRLRLVLDLIAFSLLLFGFSYWWLGNLSHEIAGTAFFVLLIAHNTFNRRWYGAIGRQAPDPRGLVNVISTSVLLTAMVALLVTSILISTALSGIFSAYGGFTVRQIHTLAAYWALIAAAIHLGLRWPMLMGLARNLCGIKGQSGLRTALLRIAAAAISLQGIRSSSELALDEKLTMQMSLDWWNFEESVVGFFLHCLAIVGLYATLTYYTMKLVDYARTARRTPMPRQ
jgi:hypothetical protein